jgi:DMSO/TMAO reductase YedYZ molybdopterin-dependent catalytic subunit
MSGDERVRPVLISSRPLNAETPLPALAATLTPLCSFYVRSHFDVPRIDPETWRLTIDGAVRQSLRLALSDLSKLPRRDLHVTLECAGNGRRSMDPTPPGLPWGFGAVGTGHFGGVPLSHLLDEAELLPDAREILFVGADRGPVDSGGVAPFARSLPLEVARHPDTMLALAMNGRPLSPEHGFPARLVVPRWYAMASVKWLVGIRVLEASFDGFFQKDDYIYVDGTGSSPSGQVSLIRVRSVISAPADRAEVPLGLVEFTGSAWSGHPPVVRVEVSVDGGASWHDAELGSAPSRYSARPWQYRAQLNPGSYSVVARATDRAGNSQPTDPLWNARGYGNNVTHRIRLTVIDPRPSGQGEDLRRRPRRVPA